MGYAVPVGLLLIALVLAGCSASSSPTPPLTTEEILAKAHDTMAEVQSYRFRGDIVHDSDEGVQEARVTGEWAAPDRMHTRIEGPGSDAGHVIELINVGERMFASDSDYNEGAWTEQRLGVLAQASSRSTSSLLAVPDGVELQASEEDAVNGVPVFHLTYIGKQEASEPTSSGEDGPPVSSQYVALVELLISTEDYRLLKTVREVKFISHVNAAEGRPEAEDLIATQRSSMEFYDYDQPITIELPEPGVG